ncbi:hypothetical protein CDD83_9975 [Cordyceps sp. RAO-2017]|nr:hypothetical protein CDD83_9975 [Cordyceps sp. RAO-2017]
MAAPPGHRPSSPTMPPSGPRKRRWSRRAVMVSTAAAATSLLGLVLLLGFPSSYRAGSMSVLSWPSSSSPPPPLDRISLASSGSEADCPGRSLAFSFDAAAGQHAAWMASVPDATPLTSLSIPGSHDSLTYNMAADGPLRCQNANLSAQLAAGLRRS